MRHALAPGWPNGAGRAHHAWVAATKNAAPAPTDADQAVASLAAEGWTDASPWESSPEQHYPAHTHRYDKVVVCVSGSIVFTTEGSLISLDAGERMDMEANTVHEAVAGPQGSVCVEARERRGR